LKTTDLAALFHEITQNRPVESHCTAGDKHKTDPLKGPLSFAALLFHFTEQCVGHIVLFTLKKTGKCLHRKKVVSKKLPFLNLDWTLSKYRLPHTAFRLQALL